MEAYKASLNPAALARNITRIQSELTALAKRGTVKLIAQTEARNKLPNTAVFCQVLVGHVAGFFPASWLLHEGVGYSPGFALVA